MMSVSFLFIHVFCAQICLCILTELPSSTTLSASGISCCSSSITLFLDRSTALSYLPRLVLALSTLPESACPRFREGAQSGLLTSNSADDAPDMKWSEHTRVLGYCSGGRSFFFILASHSSCLYWLNSNAFSP